MGIEAGQGTAAAPAADRPVQAGAEQGEEPAGQGRGSSSPVSLSWLLLPPPRVSLSCCFLSALPFWGREGLGSSGTVRRGEPPACCLPFSLFVRFSLFSTVLPARRDALLREAPPTALQFRSAFRSNEKCHLKKSLFFYILGK
jgi:hypothetical protein